MVRETGTHRYVIDDRAFGVNSANARTRISAMTRKTRGVRRTIAVHDALRTTRADVRISNVWRNASTSRVSVLYDAVSVFAAR